VAAGSFVQAAGFLQAILFVLGRKKTRIDGYKGIAVTPSQSEKTEAQEVNTFRVVIDTTEQFDFFGAIAFVRSIVHDEDVDSFVICQMIEFGVYDSGCEESCKTSPIDATGVEETIEGVFGKWSIVTCPEVHEEAFVREDQSEERLKDRDDRDAFGFVSTDFF
jgi:hypothetical protein